MNGSKGWLPWMVMLGWYLILMMQNDAADATAVAT
jgi:hypothetical protein